VSILSEALRHKERTYSHKRQAADEENSGQPKEVPGIFEDIHNNVLPLVDTGVCGQTAVRQITRPLCLDHRCV
jgi:hypothetical protein